jgi:hypothetical protein
MSAEDEDPRTAWAAIVMCEKADRWYWAEREICGFASDTEPPCVLNPGHNGDHDGTRQATARERLDAWLIHQVDHGHDEDAPAPHASSQPTPCACEAAAQPHQHYRAEGSGGSGDWKGGPIR